MYLKTSTGIVSIHFVSKLQLSVTKRQGSCLNLGDMVLWEFRPRVVFRLSNCGHWGLVSSPIEEGAGLRSLLVLMSRSLLQRSLGKLQEGVVSFGET